MPRRTHAHRAGPANRGSHPARARPAPVGATQGPAAPEGIASVAVVEDRDRHPKAWITGDIIFSLGEQEVARGSITGYYTVVMEDMAEPLFVLWQA